jgi:hypothetical protein
LRCDSHSVIVGKLQPDIHGLAGWLACKRGVVMLLFESYKRC